VPLVGFLVLLLFPFSTRGYEEITVTNSGTIEGFVKVQGEPRDLPAPQVFKFKEVCKNVPNESLVVGPGRGVRYAVLTLEGITQGKKVERETVNELDNLGCRFVPHVQAASVGQWLVIKNRDPILHAAHAYGLEQVLPQYTDALIDRAITQGINPAGKPLDWTMLRWEMTEEDLNDLIAYLKTLRDF
jgi:hypothetical protein